MQRCPRMVKKKHSQMSQKMEIKVIGDENSSCVMKKKSLNVGKSTLLSRMIPWKVNNHLIPLKLSLFLWYGGGSVIQTFIWVFLTQRGITVAQLAIINVISPVVQLFGPTIAGLIADKIGKSKPVLFANLILVLLTVNSILLIPRVTENPSTNKTIPVHCIPYISEESNLEINASNFSSFQFQNCIFHCQNNDTGVPKDGLCSFLNSSYCGNPSWFEENFLNVSTSLNERNQTDCTLSGFKIVTDHNSEWCSVSMDQRCDATELDGEIRINVTFSFIITFILITIFYTAFSNCYRFMDVTSMSMVNIYKGDLGRERFWAIVSGLIISPLSGYLVEATTVEDGPKNFMTAFYMFDVFVVLTMVSVWKLDVEIKPPGEKMWKKTILLLKNPDVLAFAIATLILGTSWCFVRLYTNIYLAELGATSMTLSLLPAVNSLAGLPFLLYSDWWIIKIGSTNLFLIAFATYALNSAAFSYLVDPWFSLLFETTSIFTYHLLWVAVVRHSHEIAPESLTATVISTAGGIHYGIGKGTGSLIGGFVMSRYGGRWAYRVIACICAVSFTLYASFLYFRWKCGEKKLNIKNSSEEKVDRKITEQTRF